MPGIDWNSHYDDPFGEGAYEAYRRVDRTVGDVARKLERLGRYDDTLIAVVSDHGHEPVSEHFDLGPRMEDELGLKVAYHSMSAWRCTPDAICAVSGNAMAHVYLNTVVPGADRMAARRAGRRHRSPLDANPTVDPRESRRGRAQPERNPDRG